VPSKGLRAPCDPPTGSGARSAARRAPALRVNRLAKNVRCAHASRLPLVTGGWSVRFARSCGAPSIRRPASKRPTGHSVRRNSAPGAASGGKGCGPASWRVCYADAPPSPPRDAPLRAESARQDRPRSALHPVRARAACRAPVSPRGIPRQRHAQPFATSLRIATPNKFFDDAHSLRRAKDRRATPLRQQKTLPPLHSGKEQTQLK
jgi:hypothetical protein